MVLYCRRYKIQRDRSMKKNNRSSLKQYTINDPFKRTEGLLFKEVDDVIAEADRVTHSKVSRAKPTTIRYLKKLIHQSSS